MRKREREREKLVEINSVCLLLLILNSNKFIMYKELIMLAKVLVTICFTFHWEYRIENKVRLIWYCLNRSFYMRTEENTQEKILKNVRLDTSKLSWICMDLCDLRKCSSALTLRRISCAAEGLNDSFNGNASNL